jgi:hypothetical protein
MRASHFQQLNTAHFSLYNFQDGWLLLVRRWRRTTNTQVCGPGGVLSERAGPLHVCFHGRVGAGGGEDGRQSPQPVGQRRGEAPRPAPQLALERATPAMDSIPGVQKYTEHARSATLRPFNTPLCPYTIQLLLCFHDDFMLFALLTR